MQFIVMMGVAGCGKSSVGQDLAQSLRAQSESIKASGASYADVDTAMALQWLDAAQAGTLIHGHTHKPGDHSLGTANAQPLHRLVLSDWDASAQTPRLQVLRLHLAGAPERLNLKPSGA